jgi:hypothetical protein
MRKGLEGNLNDIIQERGYVPWVCRRSNKAVSAWKSILGIYRVTSRQTKFFYPSRGYNRKYFNLSSSGYS